MKLGKRPARPGAVRLAFRKYVSLSRLPTPPAEFGHDRLVASWGVLGNDQYGDCAWAGAAHETILWNREAGRAVAFDATCVLSDYSAQTRFKPGDPSTDQGTDMQEAAAYRQKVGVVDASGTRHKIGAYLAIGAGNVQELLVAAYVFGAVGVGIEFPESAMKQFSAGEPWSLVAGATIDGGHYVPLVARRGGASVVITWGREQVVEDDFLNRYNDEAITYLSEEFLAGGKSLDGFDLEQLRFELTQLQGA